MQIKTSLTVLLLAATLLVRAQSSTSRQKVWTVEEVKAWTEENKNYSTWKGWILYQGSDTACHYYIARIMDTWRYFRIKRAALTVTPEHAYQQTSSAPLGYYYVEPLNGFKKGKDY